MRTPNRLFKDSIYEQFSRIGKAVSSPKRLELLDLLCQGERTVDVLAKESGLTVANASQHLQVLRTARLVDAEKEGLFVTYRLADNTVCEFFRTMRVLAESRLAEVEQIKRRFLEGKEGMEPVDRVALIERVREGVVTILDVRPIEEYQAQDFDCTDPCPSDVNGDGTVNVQDFLGLLADWGATGGPADVNGDGTVNVEDFLQMLAEWGPC